MCYFVIALNDLNHSLLRLRFQGHDNPKLIVNRSNLTSIIRINYVTKFVDSN